ncbi:DUF456 domain-containing protein [Dyadobacter jiangsuensis]|uniref:Uncharacterized protein n=1 Tax=Dyadobacter jiangsuensis TaxID=1591085 RepID=A0A2P8G218_9BACT|nr:DUF456 domain-containing protein [Dyadobacter jiangsuensis]PSL27997.1 hypothetical protein CLV60_107262 [Dyadobacter jiangsuensis]
MSSRNQVKTESFTYITFGGAIGLVLGAMFGPPGALVGVPLGAMLGVWFDKKYPETNHRSNAESGKSAAQEAEIH